MTAPITATTHTVHDGLVMDVTDVPADNSDYWHRLALDQRALLTAQAVALDNLRDDLTEKDQYINKLENELRWERDHSRALHARLRLARALVAPTEG